MKTCSLFTSLPSIAHPSKRTTTIALSILAAAGLQAEEAPEVEGAAKAAPTPVATET